MSTIPALFKQITNEELAAEVNSDLRQIIRSIGQLTFAEDNVVSEDILEKCLKLVDRDASCFPTVHKYIKKDPRIARLLSNFLKTVKSKRFLSSNVNEQSDIIEKQKTPDEITRVVSAPTSNLDDPHHMANNYSAPREVIIIDSDDDAESTSVVHASKSTIGKQENINKQLNFGDSVVQTQGELQKDRRVSVNEQMNIDEHDSSTRQVGQSSSANGVNPFSINSGPSAKKDYGGSRIANLARDMSNVSIEHTFDEQGRQFSNDRNKNKIDDKRLKIPGAGVGDNGRKSAPHVDEVVNGFFYTTRYTASSLYSVNDIGLDNIGGTVIAFADLNSDKYTDLIVLSADQKTISFYLWDHDSYTYSIAPSANITITSDGTNPGFLITNVLPGDYNYDGILDLLIMGQENPTGKNSKSDPLYMRVYMGYDNSSFDSSYYNVPSSTVQQPIPLDFYGTMRTDLLGHAYANSSYISVWKNAFNATSRTLFEVVPMVVTNSTANSTVSNCTLSDPHSNAFIDLDGDCLAVNIAYNLQMQLCSGGSETGCRSSQELCVADNNFKFDLNSTTGDSYLELDLSDELPEDEEITLLDTSFRGTLPIPIRIGDYNLDGYPDLLISTSSQSSSHVSLLKSVLCTSITCNKAAGDARRRTFTRVIDGASPLNDISNAVSSAFYDLDEDGTLDILILRSDSGSAKEVQLIHNNYFNDAFFLKALMLNGVSKKQGYGVSYSGASYKFTVLDTSGSTRANQIAQYPQSAYQALITPYSLFGLGRTNNYIELFFAGSTRNQKLPYTTYSGVIPNSQLIIIPYQPSGTFDPSTWSLELFIHPGDWVPWVLLVLAISTLVMAIIIAVLYWIEKKEDKANLLKFKRDINF
ncbi:1394_t:CDS:10 [Acaulospora colombiana]|uniref:1394_t:CDS:1 n=1 Tax=Acaulospora colombiana TaxID=27376 RepID=A0ACA9KUE3_9GLOM|nr:1394_t:CDS:10 [Acaulospora colombiana]